MVHIELGCLGVSSATIRGVSLAVEVLGAEWFSGGGNGAAGARWVVAGGAWSKSKNMAPGGLEREEASCWRQ